MKEPLALIRSGLPAGPLPETVPAMLAAGEFPAAIAAFDHLARQMVAGEIALSVPTLAGWLEQFPMPHRHDVRLRYISSWLAFEQHRPAPALLILDELAAEYAALGEDPANAEARQWLVLIRQAQGVVYESEGRWDQARSAFAEARRLMQAGNHQPHNGMSSAFILDPAEIARLEALDQAGLCPMILEAMALFQACGDRVGMARAAHNIGHVYLDRGQPAGARYWLEQALDLKRGLPGQFPLSYTLDSLGVCYRELGLLDEAQQALDEALLIASRAGLESVLASAMTHLADVLRDRDEYEAALDLYRKALALKERLRDPMGQAETHLACSILHRRKGHPGFAADCAAEALMLVHGHNNLLFRTMVELHSAIAAVLLGDPAAPATLTAAVECLAALQAPREEVLGRWYLAFAHHRSGDAAAAETQLRLALQKATQYRHLHALALELPVTAEVCRAVTVERPGVEALAGLVQRAAPLGLLALLCAVPESRTLVTTAGRLPETTSLTVSLLGTFRVLRAGREVDMGAARSQKAVSLFKFLVAHRGRPVAREQILDAIWPEAGPESADRSFEVTLSTLRRVLDPPEGVTLILRRGRGYLLNPEVPLVLDVERFQRHLERAAWWRQRGQTHLMVTEWEQAEAAYGGDFLADDPYEDWATAERERLREQYLSLLLQLGEVSLKQGRPEEAIERAHRVLAADPIRETAYRLLMRAHAQQGNRAVAMRDMERCSEALRRELGEEPMPETRELARRIRAGDLS